MSITTYWPKDDLSGDTSIRFAPAVLLGAGGDVSAGAIQEGWDEWMEGHYRGWIDTSKGEKSGFMLHVVGPSLFTDNTRPTDAADPNDAGYDWTDMDGVMNLSILDRDEICMGWLWRLETSSGSLWPNWWPDSWTTTPPNETRQVPNWGNSDLLNFMKDLMTAIGIKYNNNTNMMFWGFSEQNGVPQEQNAQQVEFVQHGIQQMDKMLCLVMQSPDIYIQVNSDPHVGKIFSGPNAFRAGCGNDGGFPAYDCGDPNAGYCQTYNSMIQSPPGGYRRASVLSQESNEFRIISSTHEPIDSPWGANTRFPLDSERFINSNISPAVVVWYCSYKPRASGGAANSGLGWTGGDDPPGVVPCNILVHGFKGIRMEGIGPEEYDRAYRLFGANGTQAALYPPYNFSAGGSPPDPLPFISNAADETFFDGETGVDIDGGNFETSQGTGWVRIYPNNTASGATYATQTVTSWGASQITVTIDQSTLNDGENYLFIENDSGDMTSSYPIFFQSDSLQPVIQSLSDRYVFNGQLGVVISGTGFGSNQGNGFVEINEESDGSGVLASQPVTSWGDTSITFNVDRGAHPLGAEYFVIVHDSDNNISNGFAFTLETDAVPDGPVVLGISDGDIYHGEKLVSVVGSGFGDTQGTVILSDASDGSGISVTQEVTQWLDAQARFTVNVGGIPDQTTGYVIITHNNGARSNGFPVLLRATVGPDIFISNCEPDELSNGLAGVHIIGDGFGESQSQVEVTPRGNLSIVQSQSNIVSWIDDHVYFDFVSGLLAVGDLDIYVINSSGHRSPAYPITLISATGTPIISTISDQNVSHEETDVVITGANFGDTVGTNGRVVIWEDTAFSKGAVQVIQSWSSTSITITINLLDLEIDIRTAYLTVRNNDSLRSVPLTIFIEQLFESMWLDDTHLGYTDSAGWVDV